MRTVYAFVKGSATPLGDYNLDPKNLLLTFHLRKATPRRAGHVPPPGIVPPAAEYR